MIISGADDRHPSDECGQMILVLPLDLYGDPCLFAGLTDGPALRHEHFDLTQICEYLLGASSCSGHFAADPFQFGRCQTGARLR
jgi:hypothetical protein